MAEAVASKKVLISGGTGFVGSATVRALAKKFPRCAITVIDRSPPRPQHDLPEKIECMRVDITNAYETNETFQAVKPDVAIHTAGIVPRLADRFGRRLEREVWKTNVEGTRNMLNAAAENGTEAFIYTSTCCVTTDDLRMSYPNINERWPTSPTSLIYGESKVGIPYFFCSKRFFSAAVGMRQGYANMKRRLQRKRLSWKRPAARWPPAPFGRRCYSDREITS